MKKIKIMSVILLSSTFLSCKTSTDKNSTDIAATGIENRNGYQVVGEPGEEFYSRFLAERTTGEKTQITFGCKDGAEPEVANIVNEDKFIQTHLKCPGTFTETRRISTDFKTVVYGDFQNPQHKLDCESFKGEELQRQYNRLFKEIGYQCNMQNRKFHIGWTKLTGDYQVLESLQRAECKIKIEYFCLPIETL